MFDTVIRGLKCVFRRKIRAFLTILGIAVGVMSVVLVSAAGELGKSAINTEMSGMGMDNLVITASSLDESDLDKIRRLDNVSDAMPLMNLVTSMKLRGKNRSVMVWGVNENADKVINLDVKSGRLLNRGDIASESRVCVIDEAIALDSYKRSDIVGKTLTLNMCGEDVDFKIVGTVKSGVNTLQNMLGGFIPDFIYIPYTTAEEYSAEYCFDNITVKVSPDADSDNVAKTIENRAWLENAEVENLTRQKDKLNNIMNIASAVLAVIAGISLVVSGISIMTVMLVSVDERTREIGIKKSIGATNKAIMTEFLVEAVILTLIGGLTGLAAGYGLAALTAALIGKKITVSALLCAEIMLVSLVTGVAFGVYPAKKAAALRPVEALRHE